MIFDRTTVRELVGADPLTTGVCPSHGSHAEYCEPRHPSAREVLTWAQRTFPTPADRYDWYSFAELVSEYATGVTDGWSALDAERPRDEEARALVAAARGRPGDEEHFVQVIHLDEDGRHVPPVGTLEEWTRWVFGRLVAYYFGEGRS